MPSTSSVTPISPGATWWTLRAKKSLPRVRVIVDEGRDGKGDQDGTRHAGEAARDDREAQAGELREDPGLDVADCRGRGHPPELDPRVPAAQLGGGGRPEDRAAQDGADVVARPGRGQQEQREPERGRETEGGDGRA